MSPGDRSSRLCLHALRALILGTKRGDAMTTAAATRLRPQAVDQGAIRPFRVSIPEQEIVELRRRIAATRWPSRELVEDRSQGVQLATLRELARYWSNEYDWRRCGSRSSAVRRVSWRRSQPAW